MVGAAPGPVKASSLGVKNSGSGIERGQERKRDGDSEFERERDMRRDD